MVSDHEATLAVITPPPPVTPATATIMVKIVTTAQVSVSAVLSDIS